MRQNANIKVVRQNRIGDYIKCSLHIVSKWSKLLDWRSETTKFTLF